MYENKSFVQRCIRIVRPFMYRTCIYCHRGASKTISWFWAKAVAKSILTDVNFERDVFGSVNTTDGLNIRDDCWDEILLEMEFRWLRSSKKSSVSDIKEPKTSLGLIPTAKEFERVSKNMKNKHFKSTLKTWLYFVLCLKSFFYRTVIQVLDLRLPFVDSQDVRGEYTLLSFAVSSNVIGVYTICFRSAEYLDVVRLALLNCLKSFCCETTGIAFFWEKSAILNWVVIGWVSGFLLIK